MKNELFEEITAAAQAKYKLMVPSLDTIRARELGKADLWITASVFLSDKHGEEILATLKRDIVYYAMSQVKEG